MSNIIVVASACPASTLGILEEFRRNDQRIWVILEAERAGKSDAINKILRKIDDDYVVFVNADALPAKGSVSSLLRLIASDSKIGVISGNPTFRSRGDLTSNILRLMWSVHNDCSKQLNHLGLSNHSTDELMVVRFDALEQLPKGVINDGAYIGGLLRSRRYSVRHCEEAAVEIDVPGDITSLIEQRRRITFGHLQTWKLLGEAPRTVESLLISSPFVGLRILVKSLSHTPRLLAALPPAIVTEAISAGFAALDSLRASRRHVVWKRYAK
jgi:cellulose synthase/poly-beta-1,6-N-acetylglucosamine synthase-like glycosyltransferase